MVQTRDGVIFAIGTYAEAERQRWLTGKKFYKEPALDANLNPAWVLRHLADLTGGLALFPVRGEDLSELFKKVAGELRHQYTLGYVSNIHSSSPRFRTLTVRVKGGPPGGRLKVRTRKGYLK